MGRSEGLILGMTDIVVRDALQRDYFGTLLQLKAMGYSHFGFRLERYFPFEAAEPSPDEKAKLTVEAGLKLGPVRFLDLQHCARYIEET